MDTSLIEYLREYLSKNNIDGFIINSTNEFLVEYNMLELNSRYYTTGFTGSTGDVLLTQDKIFQFVDTRYHEQADIEVNHNYVTVVKIPLGKSYLTALDEIIPAYFKLGIVANKTSKTFYDKLYQKITAKNGSIKLLNSDPVIEYKKNSIQNINYNIFKADMDVTGIVADDKFSRIKECAGDRFTIVVTSLEDIAYITNLRSYDFAYSSVFPAKALITQDFAYIFSSCPLPYIGSYFINKPIYEFDNMLKNTVGTCLYVDEDSLSIADFNLIKKSNTIKQSYLKLFKTVKNLIEKEHLQQCFLRADKALKVVYEMINSDTIYSEYDYSEALKEAMFKEGARSLSFKPIVAAGKNTSIIHYGSPSKDKKVENGDLLLVDYGGYYEGGMATDTTRTFVKGNPTEEQKKAYTTVLKAFLNAYYKKYSKKSTYFDIDKTARDTIEKNITPDYAFSHSTGHGVGISVHENPPRLSNSEISKSKIIENTVFTIEPGVYKEGWGGIRLENTVYAAYEEDKIIMHSFSHFPFEIKLVDISMFNDEEKYYYIKWQADSSCIM